jgi:hypothetical protein
MKYIIFGRDFFYNFSENFGIKWDEFAETPKKERRILLFCLAFAFPKMMMIFEAPLQIFIFAFNKYLRGKVSLSNYERHKKEEVFKGNSERFKKNKLKNLMSVQEARIQLFEQQGFFRVEVFIAQMKL